MDWSLAPVPFANIIVEDDDDDGVPGGGEVPATFHALEHNVEVAPVRPPHTQFVAPSHVAATAMLPEKTTAVPSLDSPLHSTHDFSRPTRTSRSSEHRTVEAASAPLRQPPHHHSSSNAMAAPSVNPPRRTLQLNLSSAYRATTASFAAAKEESPHSTAGEGENSTAASSTQRYRRRAKQEVRGTSPEAPAHPSERVKRPYRRRVKTEGREDASPAAVAPAAVSPASPPPPSPPLASPAEQDAEARRRRYAAARPSSPAECFDWWSYLCYHDTHALFVSQAAFEQPLQRVRAVGTFYAELNRCFAAWRRAHWEELAVVRPQSNTPGSRRSAATPSASSSRTVQDPTRLDYANAVWYESLRVQRLMVQRLLLAGVAEGEGNGGALASREQGWWFPVTCSMAFYAALGGESPAAAGSDEALGGAAVATPASHVCVSPVSAASTTASGDSAGTTPVEVRQRERVHDDEGSSSSLLVRVPTALRLLNLLQVLDELWGTHDVAAPFRLPVSEMEAAGYYRSIRDPVSLCQLYEDVFNGMTVTEQRLCARQQDTLRNRVEVALSVASSSPRTTASAVLAANIQSTFIDYGSVRERLTTLKTNCEAYNGGGSELSRCANQLLSNGARLLRDAVAAEEGQHGRADVLHDSIGTSSHLVRFVEPTALEETVFPASSEADVVPPNLRSGAPAAATVKRDSAESRLREEEQQGEAGAPAEQTRPGRVLQLSSANASAPPMETRASARLSGDVKPKRTYRRSGATEAQGSAQDGETSKAPAKRPYRRREKAESAGGAGEDGSGAVKRRPGRPRRSSVEKRDHDKRADEGEVPLVALYPVAPSIAAKLPDDEGIVTGLRWSGTTRRGPTGSAKEKKKQRRKRRRRARSSSSTTASASSASSSSSTDDEEEDSDSSSSSNSSSDSSASSSSTTSDDESSSDSCGPSEGKRAKKSTSKRTQRSGTGRHRKTATRRPRARARRHEKEDTAETGAAAMAVTTKKPRLSPALFQELATTMETVEHRAVQDDPFGQLEEMKRLEKQLQAAV